MRVCVHYDPKTREAEGIWWLDERAGQRCLYREPFGHHAFWGASTMSAKVPDVAWPRFWKQLSGRTPYFIWWEVGHFLDGTTPQEILESLTTSSTGERAR